MWLIATTITLFITNVLVMVDEYSGTIVQRQPPSSTVSHSCDVTMHQRVFFIRTSNFASSLTQQHCLLPQCYCCWWNWRNTEQNVQCSSLALYRQTVYSGQYSGHCAVGATDWMVVVHNTINIWLCVERLLVAAVSNWLTARSRFLLKS